MNRVHAATLILSLTTACASRPCPSCPPITCPPCNCPRTDSSATPTDTGSSLVVAVGEPAGAQSPESPVVVPADSDWPTFHGGGERLGRSSAPAIVRPVIRWRAEVGIQGYLNGPLIAGNTTFVPSSGNTHNAPDPRDGVHALDLASGRIRWHAHFDNDANGAAIVGQRIVATSDDGNVYGLDATTGRVAWKQKGKGKVYGHPVIVDEQVVVGDSHGWVRSYSWSDGAELWSKQVNGAIRGGIATDGRVVFVVSQGGTVAALSKSGQARWLSTVTRPGFSGGAVPIEGYAAPIVAGNQLIVPFARDTTYDNPAIVAVSTQTGRVSWYASDKSKSSWGNLRLTPALVDGLLVYPEPYSGDVVGIEASSGGVRFRQTVGACHFPSWASPAAAGDLVYVPRFDGTLYAVRASSGQVVWQVYLGDARRAGVTRPSPRQQGCSWEVQGAASLYSPVAVASDGTIVVGNGAGTVFAIGS